MKKIAYYILINRRKLFFTTFLCILINLIISKTIKGNLYLLITSDYLFAIFGINLFWWVVSFLVKSLSLITSNFILYELENVIAPYSLLILLSLLVISIPVSWFLEMPFDVLSFMFMWFIYFSAINAVGDELNEYI